MKKIFLSLLLGCGLMAGVIAPAVPTFAVDCPDGSYRKTHNQSADSLVECNIPQDEADQDLMSRVKRIINVVIGILGVVSVAMIILGGIQYTTSQGNPEKVATAKNIILFSVVGLIVALLAFAIVNFVIGNVFK